jgi:hypothetical protein
MFLSLLLLITVALKYIYGSRGLFVGFLILYISGIIQIVKQLPDIFQKNSKGRAVFLLVYLFAVSILIIALSYSVLWPDK